MALGRNLPLVPQLLAGLEVIFFLMVTSLSPCLQRPVAFLSTTYVCLVFFLEGHQSLDWGPPSSSGTFSKLDHIYKDSIPNKATFTDPGGFWGMHNSAHDRVQLQSPLWGLSGHGYLSMFPGTVPSRSPKIWGWNT